MDIKNLRELQKTDLLLLIHTKNQGKTRGRIERVDIQAQTVAIKTSDNKKIVIESSDITKIEIEGK